MSNSPSPQDLETPTEETQEFETQDDDIQDDDVLDDETQDVDTQDPEPIDGAEPKDAPAKKRKEKPGPLRREPGKSLLPFSRVQKIIKADKDIPIIAKDATFLISLATEEFIKRLSEAAQNVADREKRATVQHKDIATVVRKVDEFLFLEEIIPWTAPSNPPKRAKPQGDAAGKAKGVAAAPTMLDQFVKVSKDNDDADGIEEGDGVEEEDIVMNEDGTMVAAH